MLCSDQTWLTTSPVMPLAVGHHVQVTQNGAIPISTHATIAECDANCTFAEVDLPNTQFTDRMRKYLPNVMYRLDGVDHLRIVPLVSTRPIERGEALIAYRPASPGSAAHANTVR